MKKTRFKPVSQVSVLTDQVEVQGEKIRDLENSLGEYQHKLHSTEVMLQQVLVIFIFKKTKIIFICVFLLGVILNTEELL